MEKTLENFVPKHSFLVCIDRMIFIFIIASTEDWHAAYKHNQN